MSEEKVLERTKEISLIMENDPVDVQLSTYVSLIATMCEKTDIRTGTGIAVIATEVFAELATKLGNIQQH